MAILLAIQFINVSFGYYEIIKAGDIVTVLTKSLKPLATTKRDGKWFNFDAGRFTSISVWFCSIFQLYCQ